MHDSSTRTPHSCSHCSERVSTFFCSLSEPTTAAFDAIKIVQTYKRGSNICMEGQPTRGVYVICNGRVKLSMCSEDGRTIILRLADPGEIVGLSAIFAGKPYEATAHAVSDCKVAFINRDDFLRFVQTHNDAAVSALRQIANKCHKAYLQISTLGLSSSVSDKLAKLLLEWADRYGGSNGSVLIPLEHTHCEIAEMIGASRETVTRLLKDFRERGLIHVSRKELTIHDRYRLQASIGMTHRNGRSDNGHI